MIDSDIESAGEKKAGQFQLLEVSFRSCLSFEQKFFGYLAFFANVFRTTVEFQRMKSLRNFLLLAIAF